MIWILNMIVSANLRRVSLGISANKESSVNVTADGDGNLYSPQSFNQQAAFYVARGYKKGKVNETVAKKAQDVKDGKAIQDPPIKVCNCKKQNT
jgi:hypothetical protein